MINRIEVATLPGEVDASARGVQSTVENVFGIKLDFVTTRKIFMIDAELQLKELELLKTEFADKITETTSSISDHDFDWLVEVGYKPGVTDNVGKISKMAASELLKRKFREKEGIYTSVQYLLKGGNLTRDIVEKIASFCLGTNPSTGANPIINSITILSQDEVKKNGIKISLPIIQDEQKISVTEYDLKVSDEELVKLSKENVWALSLEEMKAIRNYFERADVIEKRRKVGLGQNPTDAEIESLAQTWSEHCKHKIFNSLIEYHDDEICTIEFIDSLFKTFIVEPSDEINRKFGWIVSSFADNAGVVRFNDRINVVDKIETHNAPSALDPYGGAITGIVGVNRDPMGTGKGAKLMINVFGYCFGDPFSTKKLPEGVLHPKIIRDGVHKGVIDGGNQSGIPLGRGWEFFDERFTYRPLVFCGTIGTMPVEINGELSHVKKVDSDDLVVMVGGRVGKDGIHGATFSSAELHKESPVQAVQIGDPITQKKMSDFLIEARDLGLYKSITDNGAGGLSSSVGEMAKLSNGCDFDLEKVPQKYQGLNPWEILLSEAQERMTLAVDSSKINEFLDLAKRRDVEATVLGKFTNSGKFHAKYGDRTVVFLDMDFLHKGLPRMKLTAKWKKPVNEEPKFEEPKNMNKTLEEMLFRLNICSKENKLRQYDHEVKGLSVIKPFVGKESDTPSDATVFFLEYGSKEGLILAEGKNPHYSDIDTYWMVASAIDEAVRRIIAAGGKLPNNKTPFYALDNFCWNISSLNNADGEHKLAQLVRACKALRDLCFAFSVPCISGKDSMKNVWKSKEVVEGKEIERIISIPPTLMFSVRAKISDVSKAVTMDVKKPGDLIYVIGETFNELGGSEYFSYVGEKTRGERFIGNNVPKVDAEKAKRIYNALSNTTEKELVHSIHTPAIGGLGVALALISFGGCYGIDVDLRKVPREGIERNYELLFSESNSRFIVTIPPDKKDEFEKIMAENVFALIGFVTEEMRLKIKGLNGEYVVDSDTTYLKNIWKTKLGGM